MGKRRRDDHPPSVRRQGRDNAAWSIPSNAGGREQGCFHIRCRGNFGTAQASIRNRHQIQIEAGGARRQVFRNVPGREIAGNRRDHEPSLVHWRTVPSGAEVTAVQSSPSVRGFHTRGDQADPLGVISRFQALILVVGFYILRAKSH